MEESFFTNPSFELMPDSNIRLLGSTVDGLTRKFSERRYKLAIQTLNSGFMPTAGLSGPMDIYSCDHLMTLPGDTKGNITYALNDDLLNLNDYPLLKLVLGKVVSKIPGVGFFAGLTFSIVCYGIDKTKTVHRAVAREGDQIWRVEEIGKVGKNIIHVMGLFLVDPYRHQSPPTHGWLIHEERTKLDV
jgi:hypothetical protein